MNIALLLLAVALGVAGAFLFSAEGRGIRHFTAFSGGFLLSISFLELIPESFVQMGTQAGFWILAGFFLQIVLDFFSKGLEHGHVHLYDYEHGRVPYLLIAGLFLHALFEGIPLVETPHPVDPAGEQPHSLVWGIIAHKIPVALILFQFLRINRIRPLTIAILMTLFALMTPIGAHLAAFIEPLGSVLPEIRALVLGIFLHIATTILYESAESHRFNAVKLLSVGTGLAAGWAAVVF